MRYFLDSDQAYTIVAEDDFVPPVSWTEVPERPGNWDSWNGAAWVPGTEPAESKRAGMSLTRAQFAMAAFASGIITKQEAFDWSGAGTIPAIAMQAISVLPEPEKSLAEIRFAGVQTITRLDPFIDLLKAATGLTDAQVDSLFELGMSL
jgi:hypothetical protein